MLVAAVGGDARVLEGRRFMYGIVNKVISDYIVTNYGADVWEEIQKRAGLEIHNFVLNEVYPDETTSALLEAAAATLDLTMRDLKLILGRHWVLDTGLVNAPLYMCSAASDLRTFLKMLPELHSRVMLSYPKANAPEFSCAELDRKTVKLDYYSDRSGFEDYLEGLLMGLSEYYSENVRVRLLQSDLASERSTLRNHSAFEVRWLD